MGHIYFDHNATTSVAPAVLRELPELLGEVYGNASSIHRFGQAAKQRLECARRAIACEMACDSAEIVFTSGGTEADNLAIFGAISGAIFGAISGSLGPADEPNVQRVLVSSIEHPAVLNVCSELERRGVSVTWLPVGRTGAIEVETVRQALAAQTHGPGGTLISLMHANNETGVLQPIREIAFAAKEAGALFHSDGVQTAGRISVYVRELGVDLYSLSGHKMGAPKGIGALYVRRGVALKPLFYGGHHERDRRAGTENVAGAAAMGIAISGVERWAETAALRDRLEQGILACVPDCFVNGGTSPRLPNTANICFRGIEGEAMVISLDLRGYAVSSGSACSSGAVEPSHVLLAMGLSREDARSSVRFSLGPDNTSQQVDGLVQAVIESAAHLRRIAPDASSNPQRVASHV